ncbi:hypothetical protein EBR66_01910 [bacterium]|nr:hypothetical protein [bacterium]
MNTPSSQQDIVALLHERFSALPQVVQDAIRSSDIEHQLQGLARTHKLHLDQWELLENEVLLALLGVTSAGDLQSAIQSKTGIDTDSAKALTSDISAAIFEPIRAELERDLDHPSAVEKQETAVEQVRTELLAESKRDASVLLPAPKAPAVAPTTPPPPKPETKAVREIVPSVEISSPKKIAINDPYREQV